MSDQSEKLHFEIFVAMNEEGDVEFGHTAEESRELLLQEHECNAIRIVAIGAAMARPRVELGPHVDIPDTVGATVEVDPIDGASPISGTEA